MPVPRPHLRGASSSPCEVLVVVDFADDTTVPVAARVRRAASRGSGRCVNTYGRGPAQRDPLRHRPRQRAGRRRDDGRRLRRPAADRRADPAGRARRRGRRRVPLHRPAASRSAARCFKGMLSRIAGRIALHCSPGSAPATPPTPSRPTPPSSSARSASRAAAASRSASSSPPRPGGCGCPVAEIPTIWLDRTVGVSNFKMSGVAPASTCAGTSSPSAPAHARASCSAARRRSPRATTSADHENG